MGKNSKNEKILLDTNILISIFELKLDVISHIESNFGKNNIFTISIVKDELKNKSEKGNKSAKMALQLIKKLKVPVLDYFGENKADDAILEYCINNSTKLVTQDKGLIKRAKENDVKVIQIRQKRYLI